MSGPSRVRPAFDVRDFAGRGKQTLRGGRMNAWSTYRTPGFVAGDPNRTGFEGNAAVVVATRRAYIAWVTLYLSRAAANNGFVQIFDCPDASLIVASSTWNPDFIFQIAPGQTLTLTPPKERASFNWDPGPGGVIREDDGGYPMDRGIAIGVSSSDTSFAPIAAGLFRVTSLRYLSPDIANV